MNKRTWLLVAIAALATLALSSIAGLGLMTSSAAAPLGVAAQAPSGQINPPAAQSNDDPFDVNSFNCADISTYHIDQQLNARANAIMANCSGEQNPALASDTSSADQAVPDAYGSTDQNVHPSNSAAIQSESFSWKNGSTVVVFYNDLSGGSTGKGSYSTDGGATFTRIPGDPFGTGHGANYGDPAVVYDVMHAKWIGTWLTSGCGGQGVGAWNSTDGITWAAAGCAAIASSGNGDRNSAWQDNNPSSPYYGTSYISYNDFGIGGGALRSAHSTDGGVTWSTPVTIVSSFIRDVQLTGMPNGNLVLAGMDEGGGGSANRTNKFYLSTNQGVSWTTVTQGASYPPPGNVNCSGNGYFRVVTPQIRHMGWGQPAGGPNNVVHYAYAAHGAGTDEGDIYYVRSTDNGNTWSVPVKLNTDSGTRAQWMPSVGVTDAGEVFVKWYDRRDTSNNDYWIYGRASLDNGLTWQADMPVSDAVITQPIVQTANCYMGDYDYWHGDATSVQGSWTDSRGAGSGGTQDVFHDDIPFVASPTNTPTNTPTSTPTNTPAGPTSTPTATVCGTGGTPGPWATATTGPALRYRAGGTTDGTYVYVYGGSNDVAAYLNDLWRWDPATETWTQLANMPTGKSNIQGAYYNGKIYVPGGYTGTHITENAIYDIASNTWSTGAPLPAPQSGTTSAYNGKIYNIGGNPGPQSTVSIYDIATDTWSTGASMPVATTYGRSITVGAYIYYVGGIQGSTTNAVYRYDIAGNSWSTMASLQTARTSEELMTNSDGSKIFAVMGGDATFFTGIPLAQTVEIYDIATDTWTYGDPVVVTAAAPSGGGAGGKLMVQGGVDNTNYYDTVQVSTVSGGSSCATSTATSTSVPPTDTAVPPTNTSVPTDTAVTTGTAVATDTAVAGSPTETPTVCTLSFEDVPPDSTFYPYIQCLACRGIINGYPCGGPGEPCNGNNDPYFRPGNNVTRGQFAKIASNSAGFNEPPVAQQYEDVPVGSTFFEFIWRLTDRGLVNGYPCGGPGEPCGPTSLPYFRPNANVTRGQLSKIDANAAGLTQTPSGQQFEDVLPGSTFYDYIWRLTDLGYMNGYPCGGVGEPCGPNNLPYFRPGANATRGQASKIVSNTFFPECQPIR